MTIPTIKGTRKITSKSFIAVVIFPYTPRITKTKEPEMPGKRNAVKAMRPAKISKNMLLKSNSTNDSEIIIANIKPKTSDINLNIPFNLKKIYNHINLGIYLDPLNDGKITKGEIIKINE